MARYSRSGRGDLFASTLAERSVRRIRLQNGKLAGQEVLFEELGERIRDVRSGPDGALPAHRQRRRRCCALCRLPNDAKSRPPVAGGLRHNRRPYCAHATSAHDPA